MPIIKKEKEALILQKNNKTSEIGELQQKNDDIKNVFATELNKDLYNYNIDKLKTLPFISLYEKDRKYGRGKDRVVGFAIDNKSRKIIDMDSDERHSDNSVISKTPNNLNIDQSFIIVDYFTESENNSYSQHNETFIENTLSAILYLSSKEKYISPEKNYIF